jgi:hypothetical protein
MARFVREQYPKEDCPVTAPVLSDLIPDVEHTGGHFLRHLGDGSVYAWLMRGCGREYIAAFLGYRSDDRQNPAFYLVP